MRSTNGNDTFLYDFSAVGEMDRRSLSLGFSEQQLMGQAALSSAQLLLQGPVGRHSNSKILIFAGPGNNGGDGYALACMLLGASVSPDRIYVFQNKAPRSEAALFYLEILKHESIPLRSFADAKGIPIAPHDIIVEALLGTGQKGAPGGAILEALQIIKLLKVSSPDSLLLSLDLPAGLSEDSAISFASVESKVASDAPVLPDTIHSYGAEKLALRLHPRLMDRRVTSLTLPIGFHPEVYRTTPPLAQGIDSSLSPAFFLKNPGMHKYRAGAGIILGGSSSMEGALLMASDAFFAAGGGLLHSVHPEERSLPVTQNAIPSLITHRAADFFRNPVYRAAAILIGPGLALADLEQLNVDLIYLLSRLNDERQKREGKNIFIILDASASRIVLKKEYPEALRRHTLLTPHTGEWKALGGEPVTTVDSWKKARNYAQNTLGCQVILKDAVSSVFGFDENQSGWSDIFSRPNGNLAVAGSGDVLAGILLASFAREGDSPDRERIRQSLILHSNAASFLTHGRADQFPAEIRKILGSFGEPQNI